MIIIIIINGLTFSEGYVIIVEQWIRIGLVQQMIYYISLSY